MSKALSDDLEKQDLTRSEFDSVAIYEYWESAYGEPPPLGLPDETLQALVTLIDMVRADERSRSPKVCTFEGHEESHCIGCCIETYNADFAKLKELMVASREALPRGPTMKESIAYVERRQRAAIGDGDKLSAGAYDLVLDFMRNARFDVPAEE